jgi:hypothetical protein
VLLTLNRLKRENFGAMHSAFVIIRDVQVLKVTKRTEAVIKVGELGWNLKRPGE